MQSLSAQPLRRLLALLAVAACSLPLCAQTPQLLGFQGRIATGGMNFDGGGLFKFALVNSDGTTTYWSNDGSSSGGSQPTNAVPVTVSKGLYAVMLGDTSLPQMTAIPAGAFTNTDLRLRVWFSDGTHGSQLLRPDERLAGVGYAFLAGSAQTVADGAVTGAKIAAGAVGSAQLSPSLSIGGSFSLGGVLALPASTDSATGVLTLGGIPFLHGFGTLNTFVGASAGNFALTGNDNTAAGFEALSSLTTGYDNTAMGQSTLGQVTTGALNAAFGSAAMYHNVAGNSNAAFGYEALLFVTGSNNIGVGARAGSNLTSGSFNIEIGHPGVAGENGVIRIGSASQTSAFLAGVRGVTTGLNNAQTVVIDGNGQLGTISSSRRYKEDIADMGDASARLLSLRPVTFRYKKPYENGGKPTQFGLIAEEVAAVFPELAVCDAEGQPESVKYQDLSPMLLNELLKEHRRVEQMQSREAEQEKTIGSQARRIDDLETRLRALEAKIPTL